jgi:predicted RNase H-like HicB family nuclease
MKTFHLPVVVEVDEDGIFIVSCPLYKGCHSYGKNIEEAVANLKEVAEMCIAEEQQPSLNQFIGVREMELTINASA